MGIKFKLKLTKEYEIDTDKHWDGDHRPLIDALLKSVDPGTEAEVDDLHDAIREMLADDVNLVIDDLDISDMDFEIEIPKGTTFKVPEEEEEDE